MWSQAAQEIFVACLVHLQTTKGKNWSWADLKRVVTAEVHELVAFARDHNPNALRLLDQPDSKTTLSILSTFQTHMRIVSALADAWPDPSARRLFISPLRRPPTARLLPTLLHSPR